MGVRRSIRPRTPAEVGAAVGREIVRGGAAEDVVTKADAIDLAVRRAYFEGMIAAFDEVDRVAPRWGDPSGAAEEARRLVAKVRKKGGRA